MLAPVPEGWTIKKTVDFFKASEHTLRQARKLKKEGILATPGSYSREGLRKENERRFLRFYERDVSRQCPGKKYFINIKKMDGLKEKVQKRIILGSISEINVNFKGEFPSLKIEFSTFASLQPKWFMPVAVANHTMCVSALIIKM